MPFCWYCHVAYVNVRLMNIFISNRNFNHQKYICKLFGRVVRKDSYYIGDHVYIATIQSLEIIHCWNRNYAIYSLRQCRFAIVTPYSNKVTGTLGRFPDATFIMETNFVISCLVFCIPITRVIQKVLSLIGFLGFIPGLFLKCFTAFEWCVQ